MADLTLWKKRGESVSEARQMELGKEFGDPVSKFFGAASSARAGTFSPAIDVTETAGDLIIKAEVPGIESTDLEVTLTGDRLTIKGEKREEKEETTEGHHKIERTFGSFSRSLTLPCAIQEDKIEAVYKNGVLTLKIPKCEQAQKKSIEIKVQ